MERRAGINRPSAYKKRKRRSPKCFLNLIIDICLCGSRTGNDEVEITKGKSSLMYVPCIV
jgi:hypothetical protein